VDSGSEIDRAAFLEAHSNVADQRPEFFEDGDLAEDGVLTVSAGSGLLAHDSAADVGSRGQARKPDILTGNLFPGGFQVTGGSAHPRFDAGGRILA